VGEGVAPLALRHHIMTSVLARAFRLSIGDCEIREQSPWLGVVLVTLKVISCNGCPGLGAHTKSRKSSKEA
jgi:hypothetical protein